MPIPVGKTNERIVAKKAWVDPVSLILSGKWYRIWTEMKHPHEPRPQAFRKAIAKMTERDRAAAIKRADSMIAAANSVKEALAPEH